MSPVLANQKEVSLSKRFYENAGIAAFGDDFAVELDGRAVKTPAGKPLAVASSALAQALADEWQRQGDKIDPRSMPLTGLVNTGLDRTGLERPAMVRSVLRFAETDVLCYRAEAPQDLVDLQHQSWQPLLDWADKTFGARLRITSGILPVAQPPEAINALEPALDVFGDLEFTAVSSLAAACGSLILSLALAHRHIDADQAFAAAELDHDYQVRQWGTDAEAEARQRSLRSDIAIANSVLVHLRG